MLAVGESQTNNWIIVQSQFFERRSMADDLNIFRGQVEGLLELKRVLEAKNADAKDQRKEFAALKMAIRDYMSANKFNSVTGGAGGEWDLLLTTSRTTPKIDDKLIKTCVEEFEVAHPDGGTVKEFMKFVDDHRHEKAKEEEKLSIRKRKAPRKARRTNEEIMVEEAAQLMVAKKAKTVTNPNRDFSGI